jgi:hypothetical protein
MTIVVSVKVADGIVLAADSATSLIRPDGSIARVYNHANKLFNLIKGCPIGAMTYGSGAIGAASISTISKDLRSRLSNRDDKAYYVDPSTYTVEDVAKKAMNFFWELYDKEHPGGLANFFMGYRIGGFSRPGDLAELWDFAIVGDHADGPRIICKPDQFGPDWEGDTDAIDRLVCGMSQQMKGALVALGVSEADAAKLYSDMVPKTYATLSHPAMPIQDAIELSRFLAGTAARFADFKEDASTIGGPIDIASITKHEGFKWVARKHFYQQALNVRDTDHVC